jgi:hypothetical protein
VTQRSNWNGSGLARFRLRPSVETVKTSSRVVAESNEDRPLGSRPFATAVRVEPDIGRQHRAERRHVAAARSGEKGLGDFEAALLLHMVARARLADMDAGAGGELTAGSRITLDCRDKI